MKGLLFWVSCFLLTDGSLATELIFSTNATAVKLGEPVKLRCEIQNYAPANDWFEVYFYQNSEYFSHYHNTTAIQGQRNISYENDTLLPDIIHQKLTWKYPVYEITVIHLAAHSEEYAYSCNLWSIPRATNIHTSRIIVDVPTAVYSANVTAVTLGHPFTVACTFAQVKPLPANYRVTFSSTRDGQIGVIEVTNGKALLANREEGKMDVTAGRHSTYPTFDLILTEKGDTLSAYWCALEETGKTPLVSNWWPVLRIDFASSKPAENQRLGICTLGINSTGMEYTVKFITDLGPREENVLAEYAFKPNHTEQFKSNPMNPWTDLKHGSRNDWPSFSLLATGTSLHGGHWWCVFSVGAKGLPDYKEFRSKRVDL